MVKNENLINAGGINKNMDIRTLVKSGKASYTVAIPKHWIEKNKLKKGDKLYIDEKSDHEILISTHHMKAPSQAREVVINVDNKKCHVICRELITAYLNPHNLIILKGKDLPKHVECIKSEIAGLFALEVIDESSTKLVADSFLDIRTVSVDKLIRRIDNITRSMMLDTAKLATGEDNHEIICNRDYDVNRIGFLILKILKAAFTDPSVKKALNLTNLDVLGLWEMQIQIEKIADHTKRIARLLSSLKKKKHPDLAELQKILDRVYSDYCKTMTLFYNRKLDCSVMVKRNDIIDMCDDYFAKHKNGEISRITAQILGMLSHMVDIHRLTRNLYVSE